MIIEGILATNNADGSTNLAAMGITANADTHNHQGIGQQFLLKPFEGSRSYRNLQRSGEGVFHLVDNAELLARSALSDPTLEMLPLEPARSISGSIMTQCVTAFEFRIKHAEWSLPRSVLTCEIVDTHQKNAWMGWNRAQHAVLELTILATRVKWIPESEIRNQMHHLQPLIDKTAGPIEISGWSHVVNYLENFWREIHPENRSETI